MWCGVGSIRKYNYRFELKEKDDELGELKDGRGSVG